MELFYRFEKSSEEKIRKFANAWRDMTKSYMYKKHIDFQIKVDGKTIGYIDMNAYNLSEITENEDELYDAIDYEDSSSDADLKRSVAGLAEDIWLEKKPKLRGIGSASSLVYVREIFVDKEYLGQGVGQCLLDRASSVATSLGSIPSIMIVALKTEFCEAEKLNFAEYIDVSQEESVRYEGYNFYYNTLEIRKDSIGD